MQVKLSPDDIISRGTILFSIKFVPPGSEGESEQTLHIYNLNICIYMQGHW